MKPREMTLDQIDAHPAFREFKRSRPDLEGGMLYTEFMRWLEKQKAPPEVKPPARAKPKTDADRVHEIMKARGTYGTVLRKGDTSGGPCTLDEVLKAVGHVVAQLRSEFSAVLDDRLKLDAPAALNEAKILQRIDRAVEEAVTPLVERIAEIEMHANAPMRAAEIMAEADRHAAAFGKPF